MSRAVEDTIAILKGLKPYYEEHHKVKYTAEAIKAAVELSARYIGDRKLPDKAIDVIDESRRGADAGARGQAQEDHRHQGNRGDVATMARIPPKNGVERRQAEVLQHLERDLKPWSTVRTRRSAAALTAIKLARAGLRDA
jgi:ATP-dependent Clp protease ATP-binding subunit ClpA